jgi:Protein of unknown function (DUF4054)
MTIEQILDTIAPQFSTNPAKSSYIEMAMLRTSTCQFGNKYDMAVAYRAAHDMTVAGEGSDSGVSYGGLVVSEREGDLSRSYADLSTKATGYSSLLSTTYGQALYGLIKNTVTGAMVVT